MKYVIQTEDGFELPLRISFNALREWTDRALLQPSPGEEEALIEPLALPIANEYARFIPKRSIVHAERTSDGRYGVQVVGEPTKHLRFFLPVHFAIIRTLELVPGVKLIMADDTVHQDRKRGRVRADDERIFRMILEISGRKSVKTPVARILFDAPPNAELHERRTFKHYLMVPEAFVLTKWRPKREPVTRGGVINALAARFDINGGTLLPYSADQLVRLLADLFTIADRWHWDELGDRLPNERPKRWHAKPKR